MKMSVVILFYHNIDVMGYNNFDVLKCTLPTWKNVIGDFEVIVADDGSPKDSGIEEFVRSLGYKYVYNDSGISFCAGTARNCGILEATGDRILFTDNDVIPDVNVITEHIKYSNDNNFAVGIKKAIDRYMTVSVDDYHSGKYIDSYNKLVNDSCYNNNRKEAHDNIMPILSDISYRWNQLIIEDDRIIAPGEEYIIIPTPSDERVTGGRFTQIEAGNKVKLWDVTWGVHSCINKKDLLEINGYDESYGGRWNGEDQDMGYRLIKKGLDIKPIRTAIVYHINHKLHSTVGSHWIPILASKMNDDIKRQLPKSWGDK